MKQLGGDVVMMSSSDSQLSRGESTSPTPRACCRAMSMRIMIRTTQAAKLEEMAQHATVPVINGLTDASHPCQIMADVMTLEEHKGPAAGKVVAWSGDGNNVAVSWVHAAVRFNFDAAPRLSRRARPAAARARLGECARRARPPHHRSAATPCAMPIASSPIPGCRWGLKPTSIATTCSLRTASMSG